jgi:hypothetical protein
MRPQGRSNPRREKVDIPGDYQIIAIGKKQLATKRKSDPLCFTNAI